MSDRKSARALGALLRSVGQRLGLPVCGLLTDMSSPIGTSIGNALEVREAIEVLKDAGPADTRELTLALGVEMLQASGVESNARSARQQLERALSSGAGAERFERMIALHGGDARVVAEPSRLPHARHHASVLSPRSGYVSSIDALALGELSVQLGAGRTRADQAVDPRVGIELSTRIGSWVERGEPLARLHLASPRQAAQWQAATLRAFGWAERRPRLRSRVLERFG
jgi:thymidine phosphorylase